jgi:hypothetical protein
MPGKSRYGTVGDNSPALVKQEAIGILVGNATMKRLSKLFNPPVYPLAESTDIYDHKKMNEVAEALMFSDKMPDDPVMWPEYPDGVDRTFSAAPNFPDDVTTGANGLPSSAYTPNNSSPGADPNGAVHVPMGEPTGQKDLELKKSGVSANGVAMPEDIDGRQNPKELSAQIYTANKTGTVIMGSHDADPGIVEIKTK